MKKDVFLRELEQLLSDLSEDERAEAVGYYRDYLEEAVPQDGEELAGRFGSPEMAAAEIRAGLSGDSQGEFTERGYQDVRFQEAYDVPDQYAGIVAAGDGARDGSEGRGGGESAEEKKAEDGCWTSFEREGKSCREEWSKWRKERERRFARARNGCGGSRERNREYWGGDRERAREDYEGCFDKDRGSGRDPFGGKKERGNGGGKRWWEYKGSDGQSFDQEKSAWEKGTAEREKSGGQGEGNRALIIFLLVIFFGLPAAGGLIGAGFSAIGVVLGGILGIFGGVFGLVFAVITAAVTAFAGGIAMILSGAADVSAAAVSLMTIGGGFLLLAVSMLLFILAKWGCTTAVPWMVRLIRDIVREGLWRLRGILDRFFGEGRDRP